MMFFQLSVPLLLLLALWPQMSEQANGCPNGFVLDKSKFIFHTHGLYYNTVPKKGAKPTKLNCQNIKHQIFKFK
jgi:hypothetical protein